MLLANPVELLGRSLLLIYALSGGASKPQAAGVQSPATPRQAKPGEVFQEAQELVDRLREREREELRQQIERTSAAIREMEVTAAFLKQHRRWLEAQLEKLPQRATTPQDSTEQIQLSPTSMMPGRIIQWDALWPRPKENARHTINGWRVDPRGTIRDEQHHPIGVWGVDDDNRSSER